MDTIEYSIVYAEIRPEIRERVSVGIIFRQDGRFECRYSSAKLEAVKSLIPEVDYLYLKRSLKAMSSGKAFSSMSSIDYLSRYSNNIMTVSEIRQVRPSAKLSKDKLYRMYIYNGAS